MGIKKNFVVKNGIEVSDNLIFAEGDKVGIGTTSAKYTLDAYGDLSVSGKIHVPPENQPSSTTGTITAGAQSVITGVDTSLFRVNDLIDDGAGGFLSSNTRITTVGVSSVGITPNHTRISGSGLIPITILRRVTSGESGQVLVSRGANLSPVWKTPTGETLVATSSTSDVRFPIFASGSGSTSVNINSNELTFIPSSGNLGIGTTLPTSKLWVNGNVNVSGVLTSSSIKSSNVSIGIGNTSLIVDGNLRVTGVATFGTSSVTINGNNNTVAIGSTGFAGILLDGTNNRVSIGTDVIISSGIVSAVSFLGRFIGIVSSTESVGILTLSTSIAKYYPTFATGIGSTSLGLTTSSFYISPVTSYLGIGTDNPRFNIDIFGANIGLEGKIYAPTQPYIYSSRTATVSGTNRNFVGIDTTGIIVGDLIDDGPGGRLSGVTTVTSVGIGSVGIIPQHTLLAGSESIDVNLINTTYITPGRDGTVLVSGGYGGPVSWKSASSIINVGVTTTDVDSSYKVIFTSQYGQSGVADLKVNKTGLNFNPSKSYLGIGTEFPKVALEVVGNSIISGIVTAASFSGTATTALTLSNAAGIVTGTISTSRLSGDYNINITGIASTATNVVGGIASVTQLSVSGVTTITTGVNTVTIQNGNIDATGNIVASQFTGSGANLTGIATNIIAGIGIDITNPTPTEYKITSYKPIGKTIFVTQTGSDSNTGLSENHPKRTIKAAAAIAFPGDTIKVYPGVYIENNPIVLVKNVAVEGTELRNCVVTPKNLDRDLFHVNNSCHITDLSFVGGDMTNGAAIVALQPLLGVSTDRFFDAARMIRLNLDYIAKESVGFLTSGFSGFAGNHREQDAARLIDKNLNYISAEAVGFLTSPTGYNFSLSSGNYTNCREDVVSIMSAVSYDLKANSNRKSVGAALSYFNSSGGLIHITGIATQQATIAALNYAVGIAKSVINNVTPPISYQSGIGSVSQVKDLSVIAVSGGCVGVGTTIAQLVGIVTSAIGAASTSGLPSIRYGVTLESGDCADDVKDVWRCVVHDITRGGNSKCVSAGKAYYDENWKLIPQILKNPGELKQTVATLDYSFGIARAIINNVSWGSYPVGLGTTVTNALYSHTTGVATITAINHGLVKDNPVKIVGLGFTCPSGPGIVTYPSGSLGYIFNVKSVVGVNTFEVVVGTSTLPHTYVSGGTIQKYQNFQNNFTQVKDLGMQPDPDTKFNNAINGCANVVSAIRSCIGVVTTIVGYGASSGINTSYPGNSGIGFTTIIGVTSAIYDNTSGSTVITAPNLSVKQGDVVEVRDLIFNCESSGNIGTQKYPSGKYGYLFDVISVNPNGSFIINTGVSTIPHNYVGGGFVVNRSIGITTASYSNTTGITTITAPGLRVKVGQYVKLQNLKFSCTSGAGTTTLYPTGNLGYDFKVLSVVGSGTTFTVNTGVSTIPHTYVGGGVAFPPYSPGVGPITQGPYIRNCTNFVSKSIGMRIDGFEAEPGDQYDIGVTGTMSVDSYTQYNQGGIGVSITNGAYAQLVSIFTICNDIAIYAGSGGQCDITNSNSSFGRLGLVGDGAGNSATKSIYRSTGVVVDDVERGNNVIKISGVGTYRPYDGQICYFGQLYNFVDTIDVINGGSGYVSAPRVTISPPEGENGINAQASSTIDNLGRVTSINIVNSGTQYAKAPTVYIDPPPSGTQATAAVSRLQPIYYKVSSATLPNAGISTVSLLQTLNNKVSAGTTVYFSRVSLILASTISFEHVGSGVNINTAKPALGGVVIPENQVVQDNGGTVVYTSTDQAGNFKIGDGVVINQATGQISGRDFTKALFTTMTPFILALSE